MTYTELSEKTVLHARAIDYLMKFLGISYDEVLAASDNVIPVVIKQVSAGPVESQSVSKDDEGHTVLTLTNFVSLLRPSDMARTFYAVKTLQRLNKDGKLRLVAVIPELILPESLHTDYERLPLKRDSAVDSTEERAVKFYEDSLINKKLHAIFVICSRSYIKLLEQEGAVYQDISDINVEPVYDYTSFDFTEETLSALSSNNDFSWDNVPRKTVNLRANSNTADDLRVFTMHYKQAPFRYLKIRATDIPTGSTQKSWRVESTFDTTSLMTRHAVGFLPPLYNELVKQNGISNVIRMVV